MKTSMKMNIPTLLNSMLKGESNQEPAAATRMVRFTIDCNAIHEVPVSVIDRA